MSATMTVSDINQGLILAALTAWLVGMPSEVAIGSMAGAVIFVTFAAEYPIKRRLLLAVISFFCGLLFYKPTATILIGFATILPGIVPDMFEKGVVFSAGAFVSSIVAVRFGIWLYHRSENPRDMIPGRKDDDHT
ncbi:phage holin family protein [Escherichia coli]|nr:phage holin family protein [Escherichia coli]